MPGVPLICLHAQQIGSMPSCEEAYRAQRGFNGRSSRLIGTQLPFVDSLPTERHRRIGRACRTQNPEKSEKRRQALGSNEWSPDDARPRATRPTRNNVRLMRVKTGRTLICLIEDNPIKQLILTES